MTAPNLIAIVGAGSALTLAGFGLLGASAGVGLYYFFPQVHLAVWLLILGVIMLVAGLTLVERGGSKTVEKVENELSMPNMVQNFPWTFVGLGAGAALFVYWMFRRPAPKEVTKTVYVPTSTPNLAKAPPEPPAPKRLTLSDVLVPLGSAAASYAASAVLKALGVPTPKDILSSVVHKFMGGSSDSSGGTPNRATGTSRQRDGYETAMRRS